VTRARLLWGACLLLGLVELGVAGLALRPSVDDIYRAYFIDRSSDCWPHATAGEYELGTTLSFVSGRGPDFAPNKVCGWFYPTGRGTWSYGRTSLLRFRFTPADGPLRLTLAAGALVDAAQPAQRVAVSADGREVATLVFDRPDAVAKSVIIPADLAADGRLEVSFEYPDARPGTVLGRNEDPHLRALRMVALTLARES
jgi:hypothetical protein